MAATPSNERLGKRGAAQHELIASKFCASQVYTYRGVRGGKSCPRGGFKECKTRSKEGFERPFRHCA